MMNIDTKINCVKAEIKRRKKFYPSLVEKEKLTRRQADQNIEEMLSVLQTLTQLKSIVDL